MEISTVYKLVRVRGGKLVSVFASHDTVQVVYKPGEVARGKGNTPLMAFDAPVHAMLFIEERLLPDTVVELWAAEATDARQVYMLAPISRHTTAIELVGWWAAKESDAYDVTRFIRNDGEMVAPPGTLTCSSLRLTKLEANHEELQALLRKRE